MRRRVALRILGIVSFTLLSTGPLSTSLSADVTRFISDMSWSYQLNGWGPVERDRSNGEQGDSDGRTLTVGGLSYVKGLGVHAYSDIRVPLGGQCTTFSAVIGLDDEVGTNGSVIFFVYGDGTPLYNSGVLTGSAPGVPISVSVSGVTELILAITDAGDGPAYDHADWANASVTCADTSQSQFSPPQNLPALLNPHDVKILDLNGDRHLDLAVANAGSSVVSVWLGNGDGTFGTRLDFPTGPTPKSVAIGDFNRDGRLDLATPNQSGASVSVLLARATGPFGYESPVDYPVCFGTHDLDVGDFTGDGIADLIVACWGGNVVSFLRGIGNGTFAGAANITVGSVPVYVVARDFNRDGFLDAAVAAYNDSAVSVLIGRGDGTFNPFVPYQVGSGPHGIRAGDLNGDGQLDLAVPNDLSNTISVLFGLSNGTFVPAVHYPTGPGPEGVAIGDINGDGLPDLLSANSAGNYPVCCNPGGDTMSLLLNTGSGSFAAPVTYTVGTTPFAVATGDLDGDGDLDVATANWHSDNVTVLRNGGGSGTYLSDLTWTSMSNGWGPVERDRSNGELGASDGATLTLNGTPFTKGLGAHSFSDVRYSLSGSCSTFSATVGVDDEVGSLGSVVFQVYVDGVLRFDSGTMTGVSASKSVSVSIAGASQLRLVVTDAGDGAAYDHADWADARLGCAS
jgi:hypothetical protein